jgi:hypothetical protein
LQGLLLLASVMFGKSHSLVSGFLICGGIGMCVIAIGATLARRRVGNPLHLVFAIAWSLVGVVYLGIRMS